MWLIELLYKVWSEHKLLQNYRDKSPSVNEFGTNQYVMMSLTTAEITLPKR